MTCAKYRSVALATVALIGLPALAQETQEQSPPDPQTAALLERIEQLEAELAGAEVSLPRRRGGMGGCTRYARQPGALRLAPGGGAAGR